MSAKQTQDRKRGTSLNSATSVAFICDDSPALEQLVRRARYLEAVDRALQQLLGPSLAGHCRVANITPDSLVLQTASGAWGSRLRYLAPSILQQLSRQLGWRQVKHTKVQVRPEAFPDREQPVRRAHLSRESAALLRDVAESTEDPGLRDALLRLSQRGQT